MKKFFVGAYRIRLEAYRIRIIAIIAALVVAAAFTTGCTEIDEVPKQQFEVSLRADITQSTLKVANDQWQPNDRIGLYMMPAKQPLSAALSANVQMSLQGDMLVSTPPVMYPETGSVDFIAYYPYQVVSAGGELTIPVPNLANQTAAVAQEILYSNNVTNQFPTDATVALNFKYALAKVTITVECSDLTPAEYANMTARFEGVYTQANMRLADGTFQYVGTKGNVAMRTIERTSTKAVFEALGIPMENGDIKMVFDYNGKTYQWLDNTDIEGGVHYIVKFESFSDNPIVERKQIKANASIDPRGEQFVTIGGGNGTEPSLRWLPKELNDDTQVFWSMEYDNQNRLSKAIVLVGVCTDSSVDGGEGECYEYYRTLIFTYVGNDLTKVAVSDEEENYEMTYTRNGNVITNSHHGERITVNNDGYPIRYERNGNIYEYEYTGGNVTKETYNYVGGSVSDEQVTTYKYDNQKSMFFNCTTPKWFMVTVFGPVHGTGANNVTEVNDGYEIMRYSYSYSIASGFPTQILMLSDSGGNVEIMGRINILYY